MAYKKIKTIKNKIKRLVYNRHKARSRRGGEEDTQSLQPENQDIQINHHIQLKTNASDNIDIQTHENQSYEHCFSFCVFWVFV